MRLFLSSKFLFVFLVFVIPALLLFFLPLNFALGGVATSIFLGFAFSFHFEGFSFTQLFKKLRNDGEPIFRCGNKGLMLGLNSDCLARFPSTKENLLAWLDGPEEWNTLTINRKTLFFEWYQLEQVSMGLENSKVRFKFEGGQEINWLPESEEERIRLLINLKIFPSPALQVDERKTFTLAYNGLIWLLFPFFCIGGQLISIGAGWQKIPNLIQNAPKPKNKAEEFDFLTQSATQFITDKLPEVLWIPTGIIFIAFLGWLLFKLTYQNKVEVILKKFNPDNLTPLQATP